MASVLNTINRTLPLIMQACERLYGKRDISYRIWKVEFNEKPIIKEDEEKDVPCIYVNEKNKWLTIKLSSECKNDLIRAEFQISHEVVHCLSPVLLNEATVLEEGLATLFSIEYNHLPEEIWIKEDNYIEAYNLAKRLLEYNPNIIKELRCVASKISAITKEDIQKLNPNIPNDLASKLTMLFEN